MYLRLDPKHYGDEWYAAVILANKNHYFVSRIATQKFDALGVALSDVDEMIVELQKAHGKRERGGNPDHDCTGLPFRWAARIDRDDNDDGTVDLTVTESDWQYDI